MVEVEGDWLVGGDFNAYHRDWAEKAAPNRRGEWITSWAEERHLVLLNDGQATRRGRAGDCQSTPDVTFVTRGGAETLRWEVRKELGSDHYPILIHRGVRTREEAEEQKLAWDWKKAKWAEFKKEVKEQLAKIKWEDLSVSEWEEKFCTVVLGAAVKWIGKKKLGQRGQIVSREVKKAMDKRDELKGKEEIDWEELEEAEERIADLIGEEKRVHWRTMLEKGATHGEMWKVINGIKRRMGPGNRNGEALESEGRNLTTAKEKAEGFIRAYEKVSRVKIPRGRGMKKALNSRLRCAGPEQEESCPIELEEVKEALRLMEGNKSAGPDGVHPKLLRQLPEEALEVVRQLFNKSLREGRVPQAWRKGEIIPILKAGKDPTQLGSYRPICLTGCLGKWMERVVGTRIRWRLEKEDWLSKFQAGFREGRGVTDQLVRLSQAVWDGYQRREKTGLVLFDFERAYDKVWRDALLWKMTEAGMSRTLVRWVQAWLANRLAWTKVNEVRSKRRVFQQGLPQGSVLSPLLFLIYINDLVEELAAGVQVSAFADDIAVWHTAKAVETCKEKAQWATEVVERWSEKWLMKLSKDKCTVSLLSNDRKDRNSQGLEVHIGGQVMKKEESPCFLGVVYEANMTFGKQVDRVTAKAKTGVKLLRRLAGRDWGWKKELLRITSMALIESTLLYASAAWGPWVARTSWEKLERVQLEAARIVGGTLKSAPREAVLAEAGLTELKRKAEGQWMREYEKCLRSREGEPRREWGLKNQRKRLMKKDWRTLARELMGKIVPEGVSRMKEELGEAP